MRFFSYLYLLETQRATQCRLAGEETLRHLKKCLSTINTIANMKVGLKYMTLLSMWLSSELQ